jgi:hypothetical protein
LKTEKRSGEAPLFFGNSTIIRFPHIQYKQATQPFCFCFTRNPVMWFPTQVIVFNGLACRAPWDESRVSLPGKGPRASLVFSCALPGSNDFTPAIPSGLYQNPNGSSTARIAHNKYRIIIEFPLAFFGSVALDSKE